jgi:hypothetical protein
VSHTKRSSRHTGQARILEGLLAGSKSPSEGGAAGRPAEMRPALVSPASAPSDPDFDRTRYRVRAAEEERAQVAPPRSYEEEFPALGRR